MNKKIVLLTLVSVFLLSAMVVTSSAQDRIVGVNVGDWFKYGDITVNWSSNDPNATCPEYLTETNEIEWAQVNVLDVSGTNITAQLSYHFKNGTDETYGGYVDIDTGDSENLTALFISADLEENDAMWSYYPEMKINETIVRTYPDGVRNTNHLNMTMEDHVADGTEIYYYTSMNYYWDQSTGVLVELYFESLNQTGEYVTSSSESIRITDSNIWVIPEFPTSTSILILFVVLTSTIVISKRRLLKTPIH